MLRLTSFVLLVTLSTIPALAQAASESVLDHTVTSLEGEPVNLADYRGKVVLVVNTASECGYTPQYEGLQELWETYRDRGLVVIGFPSNDFGNQEPGDAKQIRRFCTTKFSVDFPMMAKVHTKGAEQSPVYHDLTTTGPEETRGEIRWNFTKFLIGPNGTIVTRFEPSVEPMSDTIVEAVEALLETR